MPTITPDYAKGYADAKAALLSATSNLPVPVPAPSPAATPMQFGTNLESNTEYQNSAPWCDLTHQMTGWYPEGGGNIKYDANGMPTSVSEGVASCHTWLYNYPPGTYVIRYKCAAGVQVNIIARSIQNLAQQPDGSWQGTFTITPWDVGNPDGQNQGSGFQLKVSVTGGVSSLSILSPDAIPNQSFRPAFINNLKNSGYKMLRLMNWCRVNYDSSPNTPKPPLLWANRVPPTAHDQVTFGVAYEYMAELSRLTGLPIWCNASYGAEDAYITNMCQILANSAGLIWEYHNEPWNTGNGYQGNQIAADGNSDPAIKAKAGGNNNIAAALQYAKTLAHVVPLVRTAAPKATIVFGGQAAFDEFAKWGLQALAPGLIDVLAVAPYFQPTWNKIYPSGQVLLNGNVTALTILQDCQTWIEKVLVPGMTANRADADAYGCGFTTYEAGESLMPKTSVSVFRQASQAQQQDLLADPNTQAIFHPLMSICYVMIVELCRLLNVKYFTHFVLWGNWNKSGEWGVWQNPGDLDNAKSWALQAALNGWVAYAI